MKNMSEIVERQKLVAADVEIDDDQFQNNTKHAFTNENSAPRSIECNVLTKTDSNVSYINEKRLKTTGVTEGKNRLKKKFQSRDYLKEIPDVKNMERALINLLDDFHLGKLKAFGVGSTCSMGQMTKIREQQENLAKLHFELSVAEEDLMENGNYMNTAKSQENMFLLVQRLEILSVSIEQLQTNPSVN